MNIIELKLQGLAIINILRRRLIRKKKSLQSYDYRLLSVFIFLSAEIEGLLSNNLYHFVVLGSLQRSNIADKQLFVKTSLLPALLLESPYNHASEQSFDLLL